MTSLDISEMLVGKSEQLDNVDLMGGPRDFTITAVSKREGDQPLNITLAEYDRAWRPGLTMRRLLAAMWGKDASAYVGRTVRLYRDADVTFGKDRTGGTRISHASHLDKTLTVTLPTSKGKFGEFRVEPLTDAVAKTTRSVKPPTAAQIAATTDRDQLRAMWTAASDSPDLQASIKARVDELDALAKDGAE